MHCHQITRVSRNQKHLTSKELHYDVTSLIPGILKNGSNPNMHIGMCLRTLPATAVILHIKNGKEGGHREKHPIFQAKY